MIHKKGRLRNATVSVDGIAVPVTNWHPRPDVRNTVPGLDDETLERCGFWVQVPRPARHRISLEGSDGTSPGRIEFTVSGAPRPGEDANSVAARALFNRFIKQVNEDRMHVLEIGSRVVAPGSSSKRVLFEDAASYTGFDFYEDSNTDVVGDAHRLGDYFQGRKFDAVFSYSVLEHLAMPWVFPLEVNRVLADGGLTFHHTHFAWPQHEAPWDFWRFTDGGLRVLFSSAMGFDVVEAGMFEPVRMYLDHPGDGQETFPEFPAYGGSVVLARKVSDVSPNRGAWDVDIAEVCEGTAYPRRE